MKENIHNDSFEKFIRDSVNQFDEAPSSEMWGRIKPVIPSKPKKIAIWQRYRYRLIGLVGSLLIGLVALVLYHQQSQSNHLKKALDKANNQIEVLMDKVERLEQDSSLKNTAFPTIEMENTASSPSPSFDKSSLRTPSISIQDAHSNNASKYNLSFPNSNYPEQDTAQTLVPSEPPDKSIQTKRPKKLKHHQKKPRTLDSLSHIVPIAQQPFLNVPFEKNTEQSEPLVSPIASLNLILPTTKSLQVIPSRSDPITLPLKAQRWAIRVYVQPTWIKNSFKLENPSSNFSSLPFNNEQSRMGRGLGVVLEYSLKDRWTVYGGLAANRSIAKFDLSSAIEYFAQSEQPINNDFFVNTLPYISTTIYGAVAGEVDLTRKVTATVGDGEVINTTADIKHIVNSIHIPIGVQYDFFKRNDWNLGLKGGITMDFLSKHEFSIDNLVTDRAGLEANQTRFAQSPHPNKSIFFQLQAGVNIGYQLSDTWRVSFEPTFTSSITDNHAGDFGRTRLMTAGIQMGGHYAF